MEAWKKELEAAMAAAPAAGEAIMKIYNSEDAGKVEYKADNSPLTEADKAANKIITEVLLKEFPSYALLSEEGKNDERRLGNPYCFIVDPLDGTKEFIKRNGQFTVNIALAYEGKTVMGVIYVPAAEELYYASQGNGAFLKTKEGKTVKLKVSDNTEDLRVVMSSSHGCAQMDELLEKHQLTNFVKIGSSLKGCMVAKGAADIYYRFNPTMEWDTAAMQCIVEEAGGIFRQMDGTEMTYNRRNNLNDKGFYIVNRKENIFL